MNQSFAYSLIFSLLLLGGMTSPLQAQSDGRNYSVQLGYQLKWLSPQGHNFAIDSLFNVNNASNSDPLEQFGLTRGYTLGLNIHRNRTSFRLYGETFSTISSSVGTGPDPILTEAALTGWATELGIASNLIQIEDIFGVGVGGSLSYHRFMSRVLQAPSSEFPVNQPPTVVSSTGQVGLKIQLPIRLNLPPQFGISIEPYYTVFFADLSAEAFNSSLGNPAPALTNRLNASPDHVGINFSVLFYLRPLR